MSPDLATALRAETPAAPDHLRDRVAQIAAAPPPARRTFPVRRVLALGLAAALTASVAGAAVIGLVSSSSPASDLAAGTQTWAADAQKLEANAAPARLRLALTPAPTPGRAQDYKATLSILVEDTNELSSKTQQALRTTRRLGGYVVSVQYGTPEPSEGTATLRVKVPVSRVQAAIVQFSDLGRILAQQTRISDLQQPLDDLTRRIRRLERRAAGLKGAELARVKAQIAALRRERTEINRRAAFATVDLGLTTHEPEKKAPAPGRLDRAVDDATGILAAELAIAAYALIVAAPFLLLLALAFAGSRAYRRYADQRLLERA